MSRHPFTDPISQQQVVLVMSGADALPYDGTHGVEHPNCDRLADVSPELDAFYCPTCRRSGRISGAWFMDVWQNAEAKCNCDDGFVVVGGTTKNEPPHEEPCPSCSGEAR